MTDAASPPKRAKARVEPGAPSPAEKTPAKKMPAEPATKKPGRPRKAARRPPAAPSYGAGPLLDTQDTLARSLDALRARDPQAIGHMMEVAGPVPLRRRDPGFAGLCAIIASQQVSTAAAAAITGRLHAAFEPFEPQAVLAATDERLRACGLSGPKIRTVRAIARGVADGALHFDALGSMPAVAAHAALCEIHGVGPWTADIFLLFCLGHPDAWPVADLALQEAARIALKLRARPDAKRLTRIGERWRPHRGVAAHLLWAYYHAVKAR